MQVLVRYFDDLRDVVSTNAERVQLDGGATLRDLKTRLICKYEALASYAPTLKFAVNEAMADETLPLHDGDTVDILPSEGEGSCL